MILLILNNHGLTAFRSTDADEIQAAMDAIVEHRRKRDDSVEKPEVKELVANG